jgi:hypothetical protein
VFLSATSFPNTYERYILSSYCGWSQIFPPSSALVLIFPAELVPLFFHANAKAILNDSENNVNEAQDVLPVIK